MTVRLSRRTVLGGLTATGALGLGSLVSSPVGAAPELAAAYPAMLKFRVEREGTFLGHVMERYVPKGDHLEVDVFIAFDLKVAFITLFRYEHRAREIWRDGRLVRLDSVTNDNGTPQALGARLTGNRIEGDGPMGSFIAPADILPSSYWHPSFPDQSRMLDSQKGRVLEFDISKVAEETLIAMGKRVETDRFAMRGDVDLDFWYDADRVWQKMAFTIKGGYMGYTRVAPGPNDNALFGTPLSTGAALPSVESA